MDLFESIQGRWHVTRGYRSGTPIESPKIQLVFRTNQLELFEAGALVDRRDVVSKDPRFSWEFMALPTGDSGTAEAFRLLIVLGGDELRLCYGEPGGPPATNFWSSPENRATLIYCSRE
ncbi:MAG: hypothetical protein QM831_11835 [Kofleriaceae bacterium]